MGGSSRRLTDYGEKIEVPMDGPNILAQAYGLILKEYLRLRT